MHSSTNCASFLLIIIFHKLCLLLSYLNLCELMTILMATLYHIFSTRFLYILLLYYPYSEFLLNLKLSLCTFTMFKSCIFIFITLNLVQGLISMEFYHMHHTENPLSWIIAPRRQVALFTSLTFAMSALLRAGFASLTRRPTQNPLFYCY